MIYKHIIIHFPCLQPVSGIIILTMEFKLQSNLFFANVVLLCQVGQQLRNIKPQLQPIFNKEEIIGQVFIQCMQQGCYPQTREKVKWNKLEEKKEKVKNGLNEDSKLTRPPKSQDHSTSLSFVFSKCGQRVRLAFELRP